MGATAKIDPALRHKLLRYQRNEATEHLIYRWLAGATRSAKNREILEKIGDDELRHAQHWQSLTGQAVKPNRLRAWMYYAINRILGLTFGIKLMERIEDRAQEEYAALTGHIPKIDEILREETLHEETLIGLLDEERLRYAGSVVLGLNDALVELTGVLAGLTLALQNTRLIALTGLITGMAAAFSMASSEYLSTKSEETTRNPLRASFYTGSAYIITVIMLIFPYLVLDNYYICLVAALAAAILIIAAFNYYISVAKDQPFRHRFAEMAALSLGVASFSFVLGYMVRKFLGVEV